MIVGNWWGMCLFYGVQSKTQSWTFIPLLRVPLGLCSTWPVCYTLSPVQNAVNKANFLCQIPTSNHNCRYRSYSPELPELIESSILHTPYWLSLQYLHGKSLCPHFSVRRSGNPAILVSSLDVEAQNQTLISSGTATSLRSYDVMMWIPPDSDAHWLAGDNWRPETSKVGWDTKDWVSWRLAQLDGWKRCDSMGICLLVLGKSSIRVQSSVLALSIMHLSPSPSLHVSSFMQYERASGGSDLKWGVRMGLGISFLPSSRLSFLPSLPRGQKRKRSKVRFLRLYTNPTRLDSIRPSTTRSQQTKRKKPHSVIWHYCYFVV